MSEQDQLHAEASQPIAPPHIFRRLGCSLLLVFWFVILLAPCTFFYLAVNGQITFQHADVPDPAMHPLLSIQTIMEIEDRGFAITRSLITQQTDEQMCLETHVNYVFWQSSHNESQDSVFCDCYTRQPDSDWTLETQSPDVCQQ